MAPIDRAKPEKRRRIATSPQTTTPKRASTLSASPLARKSASPASPSSPLTPRAKSIPLPSHLSRLVSAHTAIETSLSLSLATSSRGPSAETGHLAAITNTVALETAGLRVRIGTDEIRRLCWLWEWDGDALPEDKPPKPTARAVGPIEDSSEDNPFLESNTPRKSAPAPVPAPPPTDWVRGGMGFIITPTTQLQRAQGRRIPAYGIGIKVETASEKSAGVALSAIAKWTADSHLRRKEITDKLLLWVKLHEATQVTPKANGKTKRLRSLSPTPVPHIPLADLPSLASIPITSTPSTLRTMQTPSKTSLFSTPSKGAMSTPSFARRDGGFSTPTSSTRRAFATPTSRNGGIFATPTSVHRHAAATPSTTKRALAVPMTPTTRAAAVPLPPTPAATPSTHYSSGASESGDSRPCTPSINRVLFQSGLEPQTPQRDKSSTPSAPSTPRQAALAERLRQKALATPNGKTTTVTLSYDAETNTVHTADLTPDQLRRRCLLARIPDAAETLLAIFATRRVIPMREATRAIVGVSRVSTGEAEDEVRMMAELCPKFVKIRVVGKEEWIERGSSVVTGKVVGPLSPGKKVGGGSPATKKAPVSPNPKVPATPSRSGNLPPSPARLRTPGTSAAASTPKKNKDTEVFGLKEVREVIRRELEAGV
ncbi:DNA replication factor Cdt1 C-terminal domain [Ceratobasidium sp. AG-Ba]|nr:DNA replication factor Cdt1 C-terminal domain [Ceratobasidium sp. AG-Ba]